MVPPRPDSSTAAEGFFLFDVSLVSRDAPDPELYIRARAGRTATAFPAVGQHTMKVRYLARADSSVDLGYGRFINANAGITASTWARETLSAGKTFAL